MKRNLRNRLLSISVVALALGAFSPAYAYSVYRKVTANADTGVVVWTKVNFGVSGNPVPTLSFFYYASDASAVAAMADAQCFVKVDLPVDAAEPEPGAQANVGNADIPVAAPGNPFPWVIDFDNDPEGHWSIAKDAIVVAGTSNNAASSTAALGFQSLAIAANTGVTVINGSLDICRAQ